VSSASQLIATLYDDPQACARLAELRYVSTEEPGYTRVRRGRGFSYRDPKGTTLDDVVVLDRIASMAIPPAWRDVWICPYEDGHLLAVGEDERGRRQYVYHHRWHSIREELNFYRLVGFGEALPAVRIDVDGQLRRRSFDTDRVLGAMLRIMDLAGLRVGNEVYAEENDSYGLSTLTKRHVRLDGATIDFRFPAKSGRHAEVSVTDAGVARVIEWLLEQGGGRWLFRLSRVRIGSDEINSRLAELTGAHLTAKDFRTWHGTVMAFRHLRQHLPAGEDAETDVLAAIDAAAESLRNSRAVARAHYVHPDVVNGYTSGELERFLRNRRLRSTRWLDQDERLLLAYLTDTLDRRAGDLAVADAAGN